MDMETLMAQAQNLQEKINSAQESLANMNVKGISGNGSVVIDMTGKYDVLSVVINDSALSLGANELSKLVTQAYQDAKDKADVLIDRVMSSVTADIKG